MRVGARQKYIKLDRVMFIGYDKKGASRSFASANMLVTTGFPLTLISASLDKFSPILLPKLAEEGMLAMSFSVVFFCIDRMC